MKDNELQLAIGKLSAYIKKLESPPVILIVEDNEDDLFALEMALAESHADFKAITTQSAESAITNLKDRKFDLVFLDLRMFPLNGLDVLREMKKMAIDTPVAIMSELENGPMVDEAITLGAWLHFRKPIKKELLREVLSRLKL